MTPFIPFPEYRPDVDDYKGNHTQVLSGVLPRGDGYGPMPNVQSISQGLLSGNDSYTKVLLHFNGSDDGTTITDSNTGGSAHTWSVAAQAVTDDDVYKFGGASLQLDGSGDWVTCSDHADFALGSGDWTIDLWFRCAAAGGTTISLCGQQDSTPNASSRSFRIIRNTSNVIVATATVGTTDFTVTGTTTFTTSTTWHHVAFVRTGNTLRLFINGTQEGGDVSISGTVNDSSNALRVGAQGEVTTNTWNGWIDEFRMSVGIARWTTTFTPFKAGYDTVANGRCRGMVYARASDGTINIFAATETRLFKLDNSSLLWEDVSKTGLAYSSVSSTDQWQFAVFGFGVVAVQSNIAPQLFTVGSSTAFADLGGSPPQSRYVAVVGRFLVLSGQATQTRRVQWSDLDTITTWTAGTGFSNYVDLPDGGVVRQVAGGEFGVILQESTIRRMVYIPGAKPAFQIERIAEEQGLLGPLSVARAGGSVMFFTQQGFQEYLPGAGLQPIGKEKVDRTFLADLDASNLQMFIGASDPSGTRVFWAYKSLSGGSNLAFDKIMCYDRVLKRWSPTISLSGEYLAPCVKPGTTLENLDAINTSIDALDFSLDSVQAAGAAKLAAFTTDHELGFFDGANLEAMLETPEHGAENGRRMFIRGFYVRSDATSIQGRVRHRANAQSSLASTTEAAVNDNGFCPQRIDTRLARGRIRIPAGDTWTYAAGIEPDFVPTGQQ